MLCCVQSDNRLNKGIFSPLIQKGLDNFRVGFLSVE